MARNAPVLDQINLIAADLRRSIDFYRRLGVAFEAPPKTPSGELFHVNGETQGAQGGKKGGAVHMDIDSAGFAQVWNESWRGRPDLAGRTVIGFRFETRADVDDCFAELTGAGYRAMQRPYDAFWGARYAVVEDPNGIAVGLASPIDPTHVSPPPKLWGG